MSDLLIDDAEVFQNVIHAAFLQHPKGVGISQAVNPYTVLFIHVTLHVTTAGLLNSCDI